MTLMAFALALSVATSVAGQSVSDVTQAVVPTSFRQALMKLPGIALDMPRSERPLFRSNTMRPQSGGPQPATAKRRPGRRAAMAAGSTMVFTGLILSLISPQKSDDPFESKYNMTQLGLGAGLVGGGIALWTWGAR